MGAAIFRLQITNAVIGFPRLTRELVEAVVAVESGGNPWAWNPEPKYRYLWDVRLKRPFRELKTSEIVAEFPPADFHSIAGDADQEWWGQQASWGLMQVMGAVAREHGSRVSYLPELCAPDLNLFIGCTHLDSLVQWAQGDITKALCAWNGGKAGNAKVPYRNQAYADRVLSAKRNLQP